MKILQRPGLLLLWMVCLILFMIFLHYISPILAFLFTLSMKVLLPVILAAFLGYLCYPVVLLLQRYQVHKGLAVILIFVTFILSTSLVIYVSAPKILLQLEALQAQLPSMTLMLETSIHRFDASLSQFPDLLHIQINHVLTVFMDRFEEKVTHIVHDGFQMVDNLYILVTVPIFLFYFLKDYDRGLAFLKARLSPHYFTMITDLQQLIDRRFGKYIRGQLFVMLIVSFLAYVAYTLLQLPYPLLLALFVGLLNIIPYFGPIIGALPALFVAVMESWQLALYVVLVNLGIQLVEGSFLSPFIIGKTIRIHPVMVILILLIGAELGSIVGMILAVPIFIISKTIIEYILYIRRQCN